MVQAPSHNADLPFVPTPEQLTPPAVTRVLELSQAEFSSFRDSLFSAPQDFTARLAELVEHSAARTAIDHILRSHGDAPSALTPSMLSHATPQELGLLLSRSLGGEPSLTGLTHALMVLRHVDYGRRLGDADRRAFFDAVAVPLNGNVQRLFAITSQGDALLPLTDTLVRSSLEKLAAGLADSALRAHFLAPGLAERELVAVLGVVPASARVQFIKELYVLGAQHEDARRFIERKLDNALLYLSSSERCEVAEYAAPDLATEAGQQFVATVCRAGEKLADICAVVNTIGVDKLYRSGSPALCDIAATAELLPKLQARALALALPQDAASDALSAARALLAARLQEMVQLCGEGSAARAASTAEYRGIVERIASEVQALPSTMSGAALSEALNRLSLAAQIGVHFGVALTSASASTQWLASELQQVRSVLEKIPAGVMLFTPLLTEVRRVSDALGNPNVLGVRYPEGRIEITDLAVRAYWGALFNRGVSMLQMTLAHEVGHGIQLGAATAGATHAAGCCHGEAHDESGEQDPVSVSELQRGDGRYEFQEWIALSDWQVIPKSRYTVSDFGSSITLDGQLYPVGKPIQHQGETIILVYQQGRGTLFSYKALARFSLDAYAGTSPWEDFAEAFAEYLLLPQRLVELAPEKFLFLEREFRVHRADALEKRAQELLRRS